MLTRARRRLVLLALPLLLLVPLGVAKWRADHLPLSKMDRLVRSALGKCSWVYITGSGPTWQKIMGPQGDGTHAILIRDRAALHALAETLRRTNQQHSTTTVSVALNSIEVTAPISESQETSPHWTGFHYWQDEQGSYVYAYDERAAEPEGVVVQPRFAPHFEALVAQLAQRAKAPGKHPQTVIATPPFS